MALVCGFAASLALGAVEVPLHDVVDALLGKAEPGPFKQIVLTLRLPRTVEAVLVGAGLGVAGALLQGALANPLASPDVIGVTAGAGFGAVLILLVFPGSIALLPVGALVFGLAAAALVFAVAWTGPNAGGVGRLMLAGIAMAALFTAGTTSLMTAYPDRVQSVIFFIAGGLTSEGWRELEVVWPYLAVGFVIALGLIRPLDRLALGDDVAASLGARPRLIRLGAGVSAALLAAAAAALAGPAGLPRADRPARGAPGRRHGQPRVRGARVGRRRRRAAGGGRHAGAHRARADRAAGRAADGGHRRAPVPVAAAEGRLMQPGDTALRGQRPAASSWAARRCWTAPA